MFRIKSGKLTHLSILRDEYQTDFFKNKNSRNYDFGHLKNTLSRRSTFHASAQKAP